MYKESRCDESGPGTGYPTPNQVAATWRSACQLQHGNERITSRGHKTERRNPTLTLTYNRQGISTGRSSLSYTERRSGYKAPKVRKRIIDGSDLQSSSRYHILFLAFVNSSPLSDTHTLGKVLDLLRGDYTMKINGIAIITVLFSVLRSSFAQIDTIWIDSSEWRVEGRGGGYPGLPPGDWTDPKRLNRHRDSIFLSTEINYPNVLLRVRYTSDPTIVEVLNEGPVPLAYHVYIEEHKRWLNDRIIHNDMKHKLRLGGQPIFSARKLLPNELSNLPPRDPLPPPPGLA
ncbi:hypothetical protein PCANC_01750 [Puccinia coronata f. sp. avenae]|uniref:Uncharacterized protein n=1 Tax=Puccinia coronata f. sp. avenae TaxID=200324 RepID=A0A2N5W566_9BASI|nr:hypothetical protein PCANC_01750 [Puccinia coronata f. sp. avenae]